jgi:hypothetical protein
MLFGVTAPRAVRPALGAMSGWDENFDKKFDLVTISFNSISTGQYSHIFFLSST